MKRGEQVAINCLKCAYYFVTWDREFPRGCRQFGIKSRELPSIVVKRSTGKSCPSFVKNKKIRDE